MKKLFYLTVIYLFLAVPNYELRALNHPAACPRAPQRSVSQLGPFEKSQQPSGEYIYAQAQAPTIIDDTSMDEEARQKRRQASQKLLAAGWDQYNSGNYTRATELFELASRNKDPEIQNEAQLGLAYTFLKTGRDNQALSVFEDLVQKKYRLEDTTPRMMELLIAKGEISRARSHLTNLPEELKETWQRNLDRLALETELSDRRENLAEAWRRLESGDLTKAHELFSRAYRTQNTRIQLEASLGLAHTSWKMGQNEKAQELFEELVRQDYRVEEILPSLMELLFARKEWSAVRQYAAKLPVEEKEKWLQKIEAAESQKTIPLSGESLARAWEYYNAGELAPALELFESLSQDSDPAVSNEALLGLAYTLQKLGRKKRALTVFESLVNRKYKLENTAAGLLDLLISVGDISKAGRYLAMVPAKYRGKYQARIAKIEINLLKEQFAALEPASPDFKKVADRILQLQPDDDDTRSTLARGCHKIEDFECAKEQFSFLHRKHPLKGEYLTGLAYSLIELDQRKDALTLLETWGGDPTPEIIKIKAPLYRQMGEQAYNEKNFPQAERFLSKALALDPNDRAGMELLAWALYEQKKFEQALKLFRKLYDGGKTESTARHVLLVLDETGRKDEAWSFISELASENDGELKKIAGDRYFEHNLPFRAARTYDGEDSCYVNCDSPWTESFIYYRYKSGDSGLSRYSEFVFPMRFNIPASGGRKWTFGLTAMNLDAGAPPENPYAGKFYRYINNPSSLDNDLVDSLLVWQPEIGLEIEGLIDYQFMLGATPLGGPIHPQPTFQFLAEKRHDWKLDLHQCSVKESILSYVGQKDPYSDDRWGRVLKTGAHGSKSFNLGDPFWLSFNLGLDYYWGKNVTDNYALEGGASFGRTDKWLEGELSSGVFLTAKHYKRNTDFYTYGHGGYFSPQIFVIAGPFLHYQSPTCKDYWLDGDVSVGYMYYRTSDAPHYYKTDDPPSILNPGAQNDYWGEYGGEEKSGIGVNLNLRALKLINRYVAIGTSTGLNTSANYTRWHAGLIFNLFFEPRKQICSPGIGSKSLDDCF